MKNVREVAGVAKQPHGVAFKSPHATQARKDAEQASQHNRDMERVNRLSEKRSKK